MSDDNDNIVNFSEEKERRANKEEEPLNENNVPWFELDDVPFVSTDNPFVLMAESVTEMRHTHNQIRKYTAINKTLHNSMLAMLGLTFLFTILNFIMILWLAN